MHIDRDLRADAASGECRASHSRLVVAVLGIVLAVLALSCWLLPKDDYSESERRYLRTAPVLTIDAVTSGRYMEQFEPYAQDAFPFRESFRSAQALANLAFGRLDGNDVYLAWTEDGAGPYACSLSYQLDESAVDASLARYQAVYDAYLAGSDASVFVAVIPDKAYYLAGQSGHPSLDYDELFERVEEGMPYAEFVDLTNLLSAESYYRTDVHWRQEAIVPVAQELVFAMTGVGGEALGEDAPGYVEQVLDAPFRGVYVGQSALPLEPDELVWLESEATAAASAYDWENDRAIPVYDDGFAYANPLDPYEVFLGGPLSVVTVESPLASSDRELVLFRDSFGSALAPLLLDSYAKVTLVDLRYVKPEALADIVSFEGADVLFIPSALTLNLR